MIQDSRSLRSADRAYISAVRSIGTPLAWYRLDEVSGTTATDIMAASNMTINNTPTLGNPGLVNRSYNPSMAFASASSQWCKLAALLVSSGSWSVDAIIKPTTVTTAQTVWSQATTVAALQFIRVSAASKLVGGVLGLGSLLTGATTLVVNTTYHVALTYDSTLGGVSNLNLYLNGVADVAAGSQTAVYTSGVNTGIGALALTAPAGFFSGAIDELRVWSSVLTAAQLPALSAFTFTGARLAA